MPSPWCCHSETYVVTFPAIVIFLKYSGFCVFQDTYLGKAESATGGIC